MLSLKKCAARAACVLLVAASGGVANAQLLNGSFESGFTSWTPFNNCFVEMDYARTGVSAAKMFGVFSGDLNASGVFQDLPTAVDEVWDAESYWYNPSADAIGLGNYTAMNIEFRASNGDLLEYWTIEGLNDASPQDVWIQKQISATAPDDAVISRLTLLHLQPDLFPGAGWVDDASLDQVSTSNQLINPGFEDFGGFGAAYNCRGWAQFPRFASNIFQNSDMPRTGTFAGFMYGQFIGADNFNGFFQSFAVTPGQTVDAEVWALHKSSDPIAAGNYGFINLEFLDGSGALIGDILTNPGIDSASPPDVYAMLPVSGVAPAGAVRVRVVIGYFQSGDSAGAVHFDDASVAITGQAPCPGDANGDRVVDFNDIADVLGNWLNNYSPGTGIGDANGDGFVDFNDITEVLGNWLVPCP